MTDPLSISCAIATLSMVSQALLNVITQVHSAPRELLALSAEIGNLNSLITKANDIPPSDTSLQIWNDELQPVFQPLKEKFKQLLEFVDGIKRAEGGLSFVHRVQWPILRRTARSLCDELKDIRGNIVTYLSIQSSMESRYTISRILHMSSVAESTETSLKELKDLVSDTGTHGMEILARLDQMILYKDNGLKLLHSSRDIATPFDRIVFPKWGNPKHATGSISLLETLQARNQQGPLNMACIATCSCICHHQAQIRSPRCFDNLFGALHIEYATAATTMTPCSEIQCRRQSQFEVIVQYRFPIHLILRSISVLVVSNVLRRSMRVSLVIRRVIPHDHEIFRRVKIGDIEGIKFLLSKGEVSSNDHHCTSNWTPMHYAIEYGKVEVCQFLLHAGADEHLASADQSTPFDYAWNTILARQAGSTILEGLETLFRNDKGLAHHQFPFLHKIVLGFIPYNLEEYLEGSTASINQRDGRGRTALYWATRRGDFDSTRVLLKYGANPNLGNRHGVMPLHQAACARRPDCIQLLLNCGSSVNQQDHRFYSALHYAASYKDDPAYASPLLSHGAKLDLQAQQGVTPLTMAATRNNCSMSKFLLDQGADLELCDESGSPLLNAITFNSHATLQMFVARGALWTARDRKGNNTLHVAAKYADAKTLTILASTACINMDGSIVNYENKTADEIMEERMECSVAIRDRWIELLDACLAESYFDCSE